MSKLDGKIALTTGGHKAGTQQIWEK